MSDGEEEHIHLVQPHILSEESVRQRGRACRESRVCQRGGECVPEGEEESVQPHILSDMKVEASEFRVWVVGFRV